MSQVKTPTAEQLLQKHDLFSQPVNIEELAARMEIAVKYQPLDDGFSAFLLIKDGSATAFVNAEHHPNRQRFSLAHEIGHFVLHHKKGTKDDIFLDKSMSFYTRKNQSSPADVNQVMEKEANVFAASLLMPEKLIEKYIAKHELDITDEFDISRLAIAFAVSEQALQIRLNVLKLAEPNF
jgi:Zn-dependent peptidase ImmA (M78 family)